MSNPIENTVITKGLPSIVSSENSDFQLWKDRNRDKFIEYGVSMDQAKSIYMDKMFIDKFGREEYDRLIDNGVGSVQRNNLYESTLVNEYLQDNYSEDPRFGEISMLTLRGKRDLINNTDYLTPIGLEEAKERERKRAEDAIKEDTDDFSITNALNNLRTVNHSGMSYGVHETVVSNSNIKFLDSNQDKTLDAIIEQDKKYMIEDTEVEYNTFLGDYMKMDEEFRASTVEEEFERIASGWDEIIETPEGSTTVHIPGSNYYNVFKDDELEGLSTAYKMELLCRYKAIAQKYGHNQAIYYLDSTLQNKIADQQGFWETLGTSIYQTIFTGVIPNLINGVASIPALFMSDEDAADYLNSDFIQYLDKVAKYDTWDTDLQDEAEANGGISQTKIVWTKDQQNAWLSNKTFADVLEQSEFIIEMAATSYLTGGIGGAAAKGLSLISKAAKATNLISKSQRALSAVDKAEDLLTATGRLTKMAADAVPVASLEARGVFNDTRDANLAQIESRLEEQAKNDALIQLDTPYAQQNIEKMIDAMVANFEEQYPDLKFKTNREAFREQAEQQYLTYLIDVNKEILSSSFDSDREEASEMAADAFKTTFIASTVKTAAVNYGFRSILNTLPFRKAIKAPTPKVQSRINSEGLLETELMSNFSKYGWPIIKNTFGEGLDEVADELIAAYGTGSGTGKFSAYMSNKYDGTDIGEFVAGLSGGTTSAYNALFDENTWKAGLIGAISPLGMVTPNFHASEVKPINGKSYTALEWINKYVSNELIHDIVENKAVEAETIRRNEHINEILRGYSSTFQDINAVLNSVGGMNAALYTGNAEHAISAKHDASVNLMMTLEHLSSDDIVGTSKILQNVKTILESAAQGKITEAEVDEFVNSPNNRGINITREEARVEIQKNAQKLLDIQKKIVDTKERLSKNTNFQSMDAATQDALVKNTLKIENAKERIASIRENLGLTSNPSETVVAGSIEDINEQINALSRQVFFLREERYRLNDSKEFHRDTDPKTRSAIKKHVKNIEKTISKLNRKRRALESLEVDENGYTRVLSAEEIKSLDNISLEHILDPSNATLFSEEQREQIDKVKEELNKKIADSDMPMSVGEDAAHTYASTLGSLYESSTTAERMNDAVLIEGLDGKAVRTMYNDLLGIRTASNIENKSRRQFDQSIEFHIYTPEGKVIQEPEEIQKLIESLCTKYDHTVIGDYINRNERKLPIHIREAFYKAIEKSEILENMKYAATDAHINVNQDIANNIADTLQSIAIDPNVNSIEDALDVLQNIIADDNLDIQFRRALAAIVEELGGIVDNEKLKEKLETPIIPDSSEGQSAPSKPVEPEVELTPEEEKKIEPEVPKVKPIDIQRGDVNPNAENEIITFALNLANGINGYTKETRQRVEGIINNASPYCTKEELAEYLLAEANRLDSQSSEENDSYASSLLRQCASKVANRKDPNESPQEEERRETLNIFERNNSRASNIESLNMDQMARVYPDSPNAKFYEKYKVKEFLESNQISNRTPVVFISDPSFVEEVEESMRSNGANPTVYSLPLVAAVEVESGGIEIDGKHYQPIALMPSTDSQTKRGAARLGDVRTRAYKQKDSGKVELVKDEEGVVITTTIYGNVNAEPPTQIKPEVPNKSAQTLLVNDASESDRRELQNLSKADRRKSPIYQRIKSAFLSKLSHRKTEKGEELVYNVPNLKGNEEIPIIALVTSSHKTVDRNSDELIIDLVKRGDKSALKSNSRIIRYTKALNKFFSETFNTSEFSFEQDDKGNVVPSESTKKALDNYATQLDNILGNFLNLPSRSGWKYKIESTGRVVDGKIEYNLSIQDSYGNTINLSTLTEGKISEDTQLEVIRNLMVDSNTGEARMRDSKYGFVVWNVVFTDAGNNSEGAKNNMADIFDDDIIEFSKESLKYTIKGVTLNAPFSELGKPLYKKGNQRTTTSWSRTSENSYEVSTAGDKRFSAMVAKFNPGTIIEGVDVGGMTIEQVYQSVIKKSRKGQPPAKDSMINRPVTESQLSEEAKKDFYSDNKEDWSYRVGYLPLWQEWAKQNPELIEELREKSAGKVLTDKFANTRVSQARALAEILNSNQHSSSSLYTDSVDSVTTNQDSPTGVVNIGGTTIDADTGTVIGGNVQTESVQEQSAEVESKPIEMPTPGKVRNRFEDSLDSEAQPKTVSPKYQWGVFEGAKMSVDEITDALIDQDIYTEEDWNNLSEQEKDRVLKCCGAL